MTHRRERTGRRKSDPGTLSYRPVSEKTVLACELPWGAPKFVPLALLDYDLPPGIYAAQSVLVDLFAVFDRKLNAVIEEEPDKLMNKTLQRGEDPYMDNLINTLDDLSELCLPSVLKAVISWYERKEKEILEKINPANENRFRLQKKLMAANYLASLVFIEVLPQAEFHLTVCEDQINYILNLCFKYVAFKDPVTYGVNHTNSLVVAEINAEVLGVLSLNYFSQIQKAFFAQLNDLKKDSSSPTTSANLIALLHSMKHQKIKTNQVSDFETGIEFLDGVATFFLEVKEKDVKTAAAGLLVEILLPIASQIKRETNIPALISFVSKLYGPVNDMTSKKQHKLSAFPLLTCLLCVSQRSFFLTNWVGFLQSTLANLKNRDTRISRVALESLYRLLWVYMIRIGGDGNTSTRSRLESICNSLFPKGNRAVTPRDAPINIFVKIIHFIAQQKLDFAFREIIFELIGVNRQQRSLYPERMNIGIRALMVIADGLQQKEEPPAMPPANTMGALASGTMVRVKKRAYISRPLTAETARQIGLEQYYVPCRKAFDIILRILDQQVGKSLMLTAVQARGKEPEEMTGGDAKPKLDLLRTCVAAIPRLLPDPMTPIELVDMLTRISIHIDDELREMAAQTLQNLVAEFPEWREHVVQACLNLLITQLTDNYPVVLDMALRLLIQIVTKWRNAAVAEKMKEDEEAGERRRNGGSPPVPPLYVINYPSVLHSIEGFALVMLCQTRPGPRRVAVQILKECKTIFETLTDKIKDLDEPVITVLDDATPYVVRKYIEHVPLHERECWTMDFATVCEKMSNLETESHILTCLVNSDRGNEYLQWDPWACALSGYSEHRFLIARCPSAVAAAWPTLFTRFNAVCGYVDPNNPQNESRASLLRSSKSKGSPICGEALNHASCLQLWQKYVLLCCAFVPPVGGYSNSTVPSRSFSPTSAMESDVFRSVSSSFRISSIRTVPSSSSSLLFTKSITMLRWENMTDMRDSVVLGVGSMNAHAMETFIEELATRGLLREASEKKIETNQRRRRRKDLLRLQIIRLIEVAVFRGALDVSFIDANGHLNAHIADFIDAMRTSLENDTDREVALVTSLRLHLAKLVALIIDSVPLDSRAHLLPEDRKQNLFYLFIGWCSRSIAASDKQKSSLSGRDSEVGSFVEQKAVVAMSRLLCCGPIFEAPKAIGEDGYLYGWLEKVVSSHNHIMEAEAEETLGCMLELNESCSNLREWLEAQCYKQSARVGARCFRALLRVFSSSHDFSCEFIPLFVLCQTMVADSSMADGAVQMIELLRKRFLDGVVTSPLASQSTSSNLTGINVPLRPRAAAAAAAAQAHQRILAEDEHCLPTEQHALCSRLAKAHPQLTITVFSEVCSKLDSAQPHCRASFLSLLLPWVENLELVDPMAGDEDACEGPRGWGSEEATQLLLNDLMYLSITQSEQHSGELGELWRALATAFPANLPVILAFLYATVVLGAETILPHAKRVCVWIASSGGGGARLAALLLDQLSGATDGLQRGAKLERSEHAPFYKWNREQAHENLKQKDSLMTSSCLASPRGEEEEGGGKMEGGEGGEKNHTTANSYAHGEEDASMEGVRELPMPAYGGHYSPLAAFLPPVTQPVQQLMRSHTALILLCDVIRAAPEVIDWPEATPRLLQAAVLSLDSRLLARHARQTIINVCLLHTERAALGNVSTLLLNNTMTRSESSRDRDLYTHLQSPPNSPHGVSSSFTRTTQAEYREMLLHSNAMFSSPADLVNAIVFCLSENMDRPLWACESTSTRQWRITSANQLTCLVRHMAELLLPAFPLLPITWTQMAMRQALSVSDRHIAGRCFQISSALCQSPGAWVPTLLARLVETAGETQEETQAYVTDLMLYLVASIPHITPPPLDMPGGSGHNTTVSGISPTHIRSTSYTPALLRSSVIARAHDRKDARLSLLVSEDTTTSSWVGAAAAAAAQLARSKSAEALCTDQDAEEEAASTRALIGSIAVSLMESGIENEFQLATHLMEKLLETTNGVPKTAFLAKLEKTIGQIDWKQFQGVVGLLTRGVVTPGSYEQCIGTLILLTDVISSSVVGGHRSLGLLVACVLPYMLLHFDSPSPLALKAAAALKLCCQHISEAEEGNENGGTESPLVHAATMFSQYESGTFAKDRLQWAKCVLKYVYEGTNPPVAPIVALLAEMLERAVPSTHSFALQMLWVMIEQVDAKEKEGIAGVNVNGQVIRAVSRHLQGAHWKDASRVLHVLVGRWHQDTDLSSFELAPSLLSSAATAAVTAGTTASRQSPPSPRKNGDDEVPSSSINANSANPATTLRKQPAHVRVRDRLVALLQASGLRAGAIPSAVSLIFSPSEMGSSAASSTERICPSCADAGASTTTSIPDPSIGDSFPRVFKEFDFLEAEHDSVSETTDSCFGWLSTMRTHSMADGRDLRDVEREDEGEGDDDEENDFSERAHRRSHGEFEEEDRDGRASSSRSRASTDRTPCASDVEEDEMDKLSSSLDALSGAGRSDVALHHEESDRRSIDRSRGVLVEEDGCSSSFCDRRSEMSLELGAGLPSPPSALSAAHRLHATPSLLSLVSSAAAAPTPAALLLRPQVGVQCAHHLSNHVESAWTAAVAELNEDKDGELTASAVLMLTQLYKVCCGSLSSLLRDASHVLQNSTRLAKVFSRAQDDVIRVADCPYLFVTAHFLRSSPVLQRLKLSLYEQQGHFETFCERKEKCIRALNAVKSAQKLSAIGGSTGSSNAMALANGELNLAKALHKLFFQLMLMCDSFCDILRNVKESQGAAELSLSPAVLNLQRELLCSMASDALNNMSGTFHPSSSLSSASERPAEHLLLMMANKQHAAAIGALRQLRIQAEFVPSSNGSGADLGCCEQSDIDVLLLLFCRSHTTLRAWALAGGDEAVLKEYCDLLRDTNAEFAAAVRKASTTGSDSALAAPSGSMATPRTSTVSSLIDSSIATSSYVKSFRTTDS
ncbi:hypothetical protein PMAYCL1PPCAC_13555 [Pristionchus mayeri]|uniref:Uncharacterized protein n=1 Tax=Pristionchus mayeri TaxID=1317129 RepID=A0AAN4ZT86_9BILA|nr:hypothetical protein PMAYCL1PPCAC_13555 [Pristionchus mayeri]